MKKGLLALVIIVLAIIAGSSYFVVDKMGEFNVLTAIILAPVFIVGFSFFCVIVKDEKKKKVNT